MPHRPCMGEGWGEGYAEHFTVHIALFYNYDTVKNFHKYEMIYDKENIGTASCHAA